MSCVDEIRELGKLMLKTSGRHFAVSQPFADAVLPNGHQLHVVRDGNVRGFDAVNIRSSSPGRTAWTVSLTSAR